jgi:hypothetical protein
MGERSRYPDANEIPAVQLEEARKSGEADDGAMRNPMVPALETVMQYVVSQEAKGVPQAAEMKQHLEALLKSIMSAAGTKPGMAPGAKPGMPPAGMTPPAGKPGMPPARAPMAPPAGKPAMGEEPTAELEGEPVKMGSPFNPPEEGESEPPRKRMRMSERNQSRIQPMG